MCFNLHFLTTLKSPSFILILFLEVILSAQKELQPITAGVGPGRVTPWKVSRRPLYRERQPFPTRTPRKVQVQVTVFESFDRWYKVKSQVFCLKSTSSLKDGSRHHCFADFFFFFFWTEPNLDKSKVKCQTSFDTEPSGNQGWRPQMSDFSGHIQNTFFHILPHLTLTTTATCLTPTLSPTLTLA